METTISVIIVNKDGKKFLKYLLPSLLSQTLLPSEIIVVDNASTDHSVDWIKKHYPQVKILTNKENRLFAPSLNQGIKFSKGDLLLILNSDLRLSFTFLEKLKQGIMLSSRIGMVCGKIMDWEGERIDSCGQEISLWGSPKDILRGRKSGGERRRRVFGPGGVAFLARKKMLEDIGLLDEKLGIYYEDLDLSWRAVKKGWDTLYVPDAIAFHFRAGTTIGRKVKGPLYLHLPPFLKSKIIINRYTVWKKNGSWEELKKRLPFFLIYDLYLWFILLFFSPRMFLKTLKKCLSRRV